LDFVFSHTGPGPLAAQRKTLLPILIDTAGRDLVAGS